MKSKTAMATKRANRIAFQGEPGANSHLAANDAYPDMEAVPCATFEDALATVKTGAAKLAMIPIESWRISNPCTATSWRSANAGRSSPT
jgi:hypothetical protein